MTDPEIVDLIDATISEEFEIDRTEMTPDATLFDALGMDSLDIVDLVVALEKAFGFKIRDEKSIRTIRTLGDIHAFVIQKKRQLEEAA
ncbi:MAG: acyl carrier protein [Deltaproteobacteria bacterium]|nr:acyl carrier protein [Deltaproteobacteria bacterium]